MSNSKDLIIKAIQKAIRSTGSGQAKIKDIHLETPELEEHGDYSSNVAMKLKNLRTKEFKNPKDIAEEIVKKLAVDRSLKSVVDRIEAADPGFINFWLSKDSLITTLNQALKEKDSFGKTNLLKGKKIMVEFAHPNTHKELHIGHMRTLILGESLSRIFESVGAKVFRANYQGDIGPHVARAIWGTQILMKKKEITWEKAEKLSLAEKVHLLGEGYVKANLEYESNKSEIDSLNTKLYEKDETTLPIYERTRRWSLEYFDSFYKRFDTSFDKLYFESQIADKGKKIVLENLGKVFEKSEGAIIFDGEKHGLHKRVFITKDGNPTYEAKDMALAPAQYKDFPFDTILHIVANEQKGYFEVIIKALELIDSKFKGRQFHLPMGMVNLVGKKMSSRSGVVITVDGLLDDIKKMLKPLVAKELDSKEVEEISEMTTTGAVKYSMLKTGPEMNVVFDLKKTIDLQGNSGPYLQYTYARTQSVLRKALGSRQQAIEKLVPSAQSLVPNKEELSLLRTFPKFSEIIETAAERYAPNLICNYLFDLAQKFNVFYARHKILGNEGTRDSAVNFRLVLTSATGQILKNGLKLLGIEAPRKM